MRATRAYVAGFGTAGSLLAGAAVMFVLASAVVSFRGWPQIAAQSTPATLQDVRSSAADSTAASRRLAAVASATVVARSAARPAASRPSAGSTPRGTVVLPQPTGPITSVLQPSGGGSGQPACTTCTHAPVAPAPITQLGTVVKGTTNQLGNTVTSAGQMLGSTVTRLAGAVATTLSGPLGATAQHLGNALGSTLTATTAVLGHLLAGK
jgi:hypothetical protein